MSWLVAPDGKPIRFGSRPLFAPEVAVEDEIAPVLTNPSPVEILDNVASGTLVGTLTTTNTPNPPPVYSITAGNDAGYFSLDPGTGGLTTVGTVTAGSFSLSLQAANGVLPNGTATWAITITTATLTSYDFSSVAAATATLALPGVEFTRSGARGYIDASGNRALAATNIPRLAHDPSSLAFEGLAHEVAGVELHKSSNGSNSSYFPFPATINGLPVTVTYGVQEDGAKGVYVEVGDGVTVTTSGTSFTFSLHQSNPVNASTCVPHEEFVTGDEFLAGVSPKLISGDFSNVTGGKLMFRLAERTNTGAFVGSNTSVDFIPTIGRAPDQRIEVQRALAAATAVRPQMLVRGDHGASALIHFKIFLGDFALRQADLEPYIGGQIEADAAATTTGVGADGLKVPAANGEYDITIGTLGGDYIVRDTISNGLWTVRFPSEALAAGENRIRTVGPFTYVAAAATELTMPWDWAAIRAAGPGTNGATTLSAAPPTYVSPVTNIEKETWDGRADDIFDEALAYIKQGGGGPTSLKGARLIVYFNNLVSQNAMRLNSTTPLSGTTVSAASPERQWAGLRICLAALWARDCFTDSEWAAFQELCRGWGADVIEHYTFDTLTNTNGSIRNNHAGWAHYFCALCGIIANEPSLLERSIEFVRWCMYSTWTDLVQENGQQERIFGYNPEPGTFPLPTLDGIDLDRAVSGSTVKHDGVHYSFWKMQGIIMVSLLARWNNIANLFTETTHDSYPAITATNVNDMLVGWKAIVDDAGAAVAAFLNAYDVDATKPVTTAMLRVNTTNGQPDGGIWQSHEKFGMFKLAAKLTENAAATWRTQILANYAGGTDRNCMGDIDWAYDNMDGGTATPATDIFTTIAASSRTGSTQSNVHLIFGMPLAEGQLPAGSHIQAYLAGSPLPTQTSNITLSRRWCLVCVIASPGTVASDLDFVVEAGDPVTTQDITSAEFETWLNADAGRATIATVEVDGVTYTADMADALGETGTYTHGTPHEFGRYASGPYLNYLRLIVPLTNGVDTHPALFVEFQPAIFSNGSGTISKVRTDALLCQTTLFGEDAGNYMLDKWELTIGGVSQESWDAREPAANVTSISAARGSSAHGTISIGLSANVMTSLDVGAALELHNGRGTITAQTGTGFTLQVPFDDDAYAQSQSVTSPANVNLNGLTAVWGGEARCRFTGTDRVRVQNTTATACTLRFTRVTTAFAADTEDLVLVSGATQYLGDFHSFSQVQCIAGSCTGLVIGYGGLESTTTPVTSGNWGLFATKYLMGSRLRIRGWHGTPTDVHLAFDPTYLIDETKMLPPADLARMPDLAATITSDKAILDALPQQAATGSQRHLRPYIANTFTTNGATLGFTHNIAGSAEWSPLNRYALEWLQKPTDPNAWDQLATRAEASNWITHFSRIDEVTGLFVDIDTATRWNHTQNLNYGTPNVTQWYLGNKHTGTFANFWQYHTSFDGGHMEPIAETYFMMTGDLWAFQNIVGCQQALWASSNPSYRSITNKGSSLNWQNNMGGRPAANTVHQLGQMIALWPESPDDVIGGKASWKARLDFFQSSIYSMYVTPGPDLLGFYPYALGADTTMRKGDFNFFQYSEGFEVIILFHQTYYGEALGRILAMGALGSQGSAIVEAQLGWILDSVDGGDWHPAHYGSMPAGLGLRTSPRKPYGSLAEAYRALREDKYPNQVTGPSGSNAFSYTTPIATLTLSSAAIGERTATFSVPVPWPEHDGSFISPTSVANGLGTILDVVSPTSALVSVTTAFNATSYISGNWRLGLPAPTATPTGLLGDRSQTSTNNYLALLIGCVALAKQFPALETRAQAAYDMLIGLLEDLNGATPYNTGTALYAMRPY
jgi:hypothetical protein